MEVILRQRLGGRTLRPGRMARPWPALAAGLLAGTFLLAALQLLAWTVYDEPAWKILRFIAATAGGTRILAEDGFDASVVATGIVLHFALSLVYALAFAALAIWIPRAALAWAGIAFGTALYYANLYGFTAFFPWFAELRTPDTLAAHALFGLLLGLGYAAFTERSRRRR